MDRAEIRRQAKKASKKNKVYTLTQAQIDKMKEDIFDDAIDYSFSLMMSFSTKSLLKYWKKTAPKRIPEFLNDCIKLYKDVETRAVLLPDLEKEIEEACGVKMSCLERVEKIREEIRMGAR